MKFLGTELRNAKRIHSFVANPLADAKDLNILHSSSVMSRTNLRSNSWVSFAMCVMFSMLYKCI